MAAEDYEKCLELEPNNKTFIEKLEDSRKNLILNPSETNLDIKDDGNLQEHNDILETLPNTSYLNASLVQKSKSQKNNYQNTQK